MKRAAVLLVMFLVAVSLSACNCIEKRSDTVCSEEQCDTVCSEEQCDTVCSEEQCDTVCSEEQCDTVCSENLHASVDCVYENNLNLD